MAISKSKLLVYQRVGWVPRKRESSDEPWGLQTLHSDEADGLVIMRVVEGAVNKWNWITWICVQMLYWWSKPASTL